MGVVTSRSWSRAWPAWLYVKHESGRSIQPLVSRSQHARVPPVATPAAAPRGQASSEARHHPRAAEPGELRSPRRIRSVRERASAGLAHLVARRRRAHGAELDAEGLVVYLHGVGEGVVVGIVHPRFHHPLVAVASLKEGRGDHERGPSGPGVNRRSRRLFATTDTDESAMASPARIGESVTPQSG